MKGYQLKLDFGEGQECHKLYEEFLQESGTEDTAENWQIFTKCFALVRGIELMEEKARNTLQ